MSYKGNRWITAYVDGACFNNGQPGARAGYGVWFGQNHSENISAPVENAPPTNQNAEIQAATAAIHAAYDMGYRNVNIVTDSDFLIKAATIWMPNWIQNGWVTNRGEAVRNRYSFERLDDAIEMMNRVEFKFVNSHTGNHGNECADYLAKQGAKMYQGY